MTIVLIATGMCLWLIGGNVLVAFHYRRRGLPAWSGLRPFDFPFGSFNKWEWLILIALAFSSLGIMAVGINLQHAAT